MLGAAVSVDVSTILLPRDPHHEFVRVMTHATVEKRTEDWDAAFGAGVVRVKEGRSGRGERNRPVLTQQSPPLMMINAALRELLLNAAKRRQG